MGGVSCQKQTTVLHRLDHVAPHARDAFLQDPAFVQVPILAAGQARLQLLPNSIVGPLLEVFVRSTLQVQARDLRRTHAVQSEASVVIGVDQFFRRGRRFCQDAEPPEWILTVVDGQSVWRDTWLADAVGPITPGDEVTVDFAGLACMLVVDFWLAAREAFDANVVSLEQDLTAGCEPSLNEIFDHFVLTVNGNRFSGEVFEIDAVALSAETQFDAV